MNKMAIGMDGQINVGVVGIGKRGILHTGILSSLDGVDVGYHKQITGATK